MTVFRVVVLRGPSIKLMMLAEDGVAKRISMATSMTLSFQPTIVPE